MAGRLCQTRSFADSSWQDPQLVGLPVGPYRASYRAIIIRWDVGGELKQIWDSAQHLCAEVSFCNSVVGTMSSSFLWSSENGRAQLYSYPETQIFAKSSPDVKQIQVSDGPYPWLVWNNFASSNDGLYLTLNSDLVYHMDTAGSESTISSPRGDGKFGLISSPAWKDNDVCYMSRGSFGTISGNTCNESFFADGSIYSTHGATGVSSLSTTSFWGAIRQSGSGVYVLGSATNVVGWTSYPQITVSNGLLRLSSGTLSLIVPESEIASAIGGGVAFGTAKMLDLPNGDVVLLVPEAYYGGNPENIHVFNCSTGGITSHWVVNSPGSFYGAFFGPYGFGSNLLGADRVFDNGDFLCRTGVGTLKRINQYGDVITVYSVPAGTAGRTLVSCWYDGSNVWACT